MNIATDGYGLDSLRHNVPTNGYGYGFRVIGRLIDRYTFGPIPVDTLSHGRRGGRVTATRRRR